MTSGAPAAGVAALLCPTTTITDLLSAAADRRAGQTYLSFDDTPTTVADLWVETAHAAARLDELDVRPGTRVAVMLDNHPQHVALIFALIIRGAVWVPINTRQRGEPLRHQLDLTGPTLLITEDAYAAVVGEVHPIRVVVWHPVDRRQPAAPVRPVDSSPDDVIALMFTSGTSGPAKAVQVTDRMLRASAYGAALTTDVVDRDVLLMWEPLCHIGGAQVLLLPLVCGARIALLPRFSASRFWEQVQQTDATLIHHLGGILSILLSRPAEPAERDHRVRLSWGGGVDATTWRAVAERFGIEVAECYGMTEVSSIVTINRVGPEHGIGRALPYVEVGVHDQDGRPVPDGAPGEIVLRPLRAGLVTPGYLNNDAATAASRRGPYWRTGDAGRLFDGDLHFTGRLGDSVRHHGENIAAIDVESVVNRHPSVAECALVGVPGLHGDQDLALFMATADGASADPQQLLDWCHEQLASFMVPRYLVIIDAFTRTASQRIVKRDLRDRSDPWWDSDRGDWTQPCWPVGEGS